MFGLRAAGNGFLWAPARGSCCSGVLCRQGKGQHGPSSGTSSGCTALNASRERGRTTASVRKANPTRQI
ncbi:unnamed protein product [Coccothraustes coccothraustes]